MSSYYINGGRRLSGSIFAQGSKNSALPILVATFLVGGKSVIHNCPMLSDVSVTLKILEHLGCNVVREENDVIIDSENAFRCDIPLELMRELRSSVIFLGALLGKCGKASVSTPGGCEIGLRPIDLHIYAMKELGAFVKSEYGNLLCSCRDGLKGTTITFSFPSVGATENAILASCTAKGTTTIINAAREPEIIDLCSFLNGCGAKISGFGESIIIIEGVKKLHGTEHTVIFDRIAAVTYLAACAVTNGDITVKNIIPDHLNAIIPVFKETGCEIAVRCNEIRLKAPKRLLKTNKIITQPYPGFPTDAQAPIMAMTAICDGTSVIVENIFESRFKHVAELVRMGANIRTQGRVAVVEGVKRLYGARVVSTDLRGGGALVVAGLCAEGETTVEKISHIERGYEKLDYNLRMLNCDIRKEMDDE